MCVEDAPLLDCRNVVAGSRVAHLVDEEHGEQRSLGLEANLNDKYLDIEREDREPACNPS